MLFKNTTRDDLDLPTLGVTVKAHQTVEVTGEDAKALARNPNFERVDEPKTRKHDDEPAEAQADVEEPSE